MRKRLILCQSTENGPSSGKVPPEPQVFIRRRRRPLRRLTTSFDLPCRASRHPRIEWSNPGSGKPWAPAGAKPTQEERSWTKENCKSGVDRDTRATPRRLNVAALIPRKDVFINCPFDDAYKPISRRSSLRFAISGLLPSLTTLINSPAARQSPSSASSTQTIREAPLPSGET